MVTEYTDLKWKMFEIVSRIDLKHKNLIILSWCCLVVSQFDCYILTSIIEFT